MLINMVLVFTSLYKVVMHANMKCISIESVPTTAENPEGWLNQSWIALFAYYISPSAFDHLKVPFLIQ